MSFVVFPNPQDALPLPRRPNLDGYRKHAKELVRACKSTDATAVNRWAEKWVNMVVKQSGISLTRSPFAITRWIDQVGQFAQRELITKNASGRLTGAQFVIARAHGFDNWIKFSKFLNALRTKKSAVARFESAADAIIEGDL